MAHISEEFGFRPVRLFGPQLLGFVTAHRLAQVLARAFEDIDRHLKFAFVPGPAFRLDPGVGHVVADRDPPLTDGPVADDLEIAIAGEGNLGVRDGFLADRRREVIEEIGGVDADGAGQLAHRHAFAQGLAVRLEHRHEGVVPGGETAIGVPEEEDLGQGAQGLAQPEDEIVTFLSAEDTLIHGDHHPVALATAGEGLDPDRLEMPVRPFHPHPALLAAAIAEQQAEDRRPVFGMNEAAQGDVIHMPVFPVIAERRAGRRRQGNPVPVRLPAPATGAFRAEQPLHQLLAARIGQGLEAPGTDRHGEERPGEGRDGQSGGEIGSEGPEGIMGRRRDRHQALVAGQGTGRRHHMTAVLGAQPGGPAGGRQAGEVVEGQLHVPGGYRRDIGAVAKVENVMAAILGQLTGQHTADPGGQRHPRPEGQRR